MHYPRKVIIVNVHSTKLFILTFKMVCDCMQNSLRNLTNNKYFKPFPMFRHLFFNLIYIYNLYIYSNYCHYTNNITKKSQQKSRQQLFLFKQKEYQAKWKYMIYRSSLFACTLDEHTHKFLFWLYWREWGGGNWIGNEYIFHIKIVYPSKHKQY